jgi:GTPase-associated protein 1, N-terminal domain type 2/GTPase-associated protein 1, middle domain
MVIQQQYYTSWHNHKTQKTGFQVKAESPGITPEIANTFNKLIGYSIPSSADVSAFATHPVAFRYYVDNNLAILISSQSNGKDELGRSGNFFAHSIVGTLEEITYPLAPIFYWKSPFWVSKDESDETALPSIEQFDAEVVFDFDSVWTFVNENNRREWFSQLICAVIDNHQSQRRIIIVDDAESVALWIAAISTVLPPKYCHFLSFCTYHHDPGRVPFIITGTTADSNFRCTSDAYISYFIINTYEGCVSEAPVSDYADYILRRLTPEQYEDEVLDFFNWVERLDSKPQAISRELDNYLNFYQAANSKLVEIEPIKLVAAIRSVIAIISHKEVAIELLDVADIRTACEILGDSLLRRQDRELIQEYQHSLQILKRLDKNFGETFEKAFAVLSGLVLQKRQQDASILSSIITEFYQVSLRTSILNQPENIQNWANQLRDDDAEQAAIFWQFLGKDFQFTQATEAPLRAIIAKTFTALQQQASASPLHVPTIVAQAIATMISALGITADFLLTTAAVVKKCNSTSLVLEWLYYGLVENLTVQERSQHYWRYWQIFQQEAPNLYSYELQRDLIKISTHEEIIRTICDWADSVHTNSRTRIVNEAVTFLLSEEFLKLSTVDRRKLILHLLLAESLSQDIDRKLYIQFVESFLSEATICKLDSLTLRLYEKLLLDVATPSFKERSISFTYPYPQMNEPTAAQDRLKIYWQHQTIIRGAIDLTKGRLQESTVEELYKYFDTISSDKYEQEASELFKEFFASKIDSEAHFKLVRGVYIKRHRVEFWKMYWSSFQSCLIDNERINEIVRIMDLWFNTSANLTSHPYVVPEFFTELPSMLEAIQSSKNYRRIERTFKSQLTGKDWYPVIEKYLQKSRKGLLGNFF